MTASHPPTEARRLVELLTRQRDLYKHLTTLSEKQRALISGDRPELLLSILRKRQDLVTALARLNEDLGPYRRHWDAVYAGLPESLRFEASTLLTEINALLRVILRTDQEDSALLSARKSAVSAELAEITGIRKAGAAYARQGAGSTPQVADIQG